MSPADAPYTYQVTDLVLLHDMHREVCEPQVSDVDATVAVLSHFVLTTQTLPSAVQVQPGTFLAMSPIYEELSPVYPHLARVACRFPTVSIRTYC